MTTIPPRVACVLLGPAGLSSYLRTHGGEDHEVDLTILRLTVAARRHTLQRTVRTAALSTDNSDHELVSTEQAARATGLHRSTISRMINRGDLAAVLVGGRWAIRLGDLAQLAEQRAAA